MLSILLDLVLSVVKKLLFFLFIFVVVFYFWNNFKKKREDRTFLVSFNNIEGLAKGAPVFANGVQVGKVIKVFPLGNTNRVAVKGLLTNKEFPSPKAGVQAEIITNFETGGGKVLEITHLIEDYKDEVGVREHDFLNKKGRIKGHNLYSTKHLVRVMRDVYQMTKDFSKDILANLNSRESIEYRQEFGNSLQNTITSMEYGTLKQDIENSIQGLNKDIKHFEELPNKRVKVERAMRNQVQALRNTLETYGNLSGTYQ